MEMFLLNFISGVQPSTDHQIKARGHKYQD